MKKCLNIIILYQTQSACESFHCNRKSEWLEVLNMEALFLLRNENSADENLQGVFVMFVVAIFENKLTN